MPRLAKAADISNWLSVLVSSLSKYRNVLSNCSSCAGVRLVILRDTIWTAGSGKVEKGATSIQTWLSRNAIFFEMFWITNSNSNLRS